MVEVGDLSLQAVDVAQIERAAHMEDAARLEAELGGDELLELLVEVALDLEAHRLEALAHLEDLLHVLTIVLLLLDALVVRVDVGVARDAQDGGVLRVEIAEAGAEAGADHVLDERVAVALGAGGQGHHALLGRGHLDDTEKPRLGGAGERRPLRRFGKGWRGSTTSGLAMGEIFSSKSFLTAARSSSV